VVSDGIEIKRRKRIITAAVMAACAVMIAVSGALLYYWYPTTPIYSLLKVSNAVKTHDWNTFSRYVDMDRLSMELAKEITFIAYKKMDDKGIPSHISKNLAVRYGTMVRKSLPGDIEAWIRNGTPPAASVLNSMVKGPSSTKFKLKGISWKDDIAHAKVSSGKTGVLEIELIREQGSWRITRIDNLIELYEKSKG
jgi:hypothetical protein